ncbi:uncharacterized protein METZ01_LOCUS491507, partial [marine metagenome]
MHIYAERMPTIVYRQVCRPLKLCAPVARHYSPAIRGG